MSEPLAIECSLCKAAVGEWCAKDGNDRKWRNGAPVHICRIEQAAKEAAARRFVADFH